MNLGLLPSHLNIQKYVEMKEILYGNNYSCSVEFRHQSKHVASLLHVVYAEEHDLGLALLAN